METYAIAHHSTCVYTNTITMNIIHCVYIYDIVGVTINDSGYIDTFNIYCTRSRLCVVLFLLGKMTHVERNTKSVVFSVK